jgi:hypothetical protein
MRHRQTFQQPPQPRPRPSGRRQLQRQRPWSAHPVRQPLYPVSPLGAFDELASGARGLVTRHPLTSVALVGLAGFLLGRR